MPRREIGDTTVVKAMELAKQLNLPLYYVISEAEKYTELQRAAQKLKAFCSIIEELRDKARDVSIHQLLSLMLETTGYVDMLKEEGYEGQTRLENVEELSSSILLYEKEVTEPTLFGFLEQVALVSDLDNYDENSDSVVMMTLHCAKGLEFNNVFLTGMEEGIFPGMQTIYAGERAIEEERRLAYVGITRSKKKLYITNAYTRMLFGTTSRNKVSRFVEEIPKGCCNTTYRNFIYEVHNFAPKPASEYNFKQQHTSYLSPWLGLFFTILMAVIMAVIISA